jgi:hypothetical protein
MDQKCSKSNNTMKHRLDILACIATVFLAMKCGFFTFETETETWKTIFAIVGVVSATTGLVNLIYKALNKLRRGSAEGEGADEA